MQPQCLESQESFLSYSRCELILACRVFVLIAFLLTLNCGMDIQVDLNVRGKNTMSSGGPLTMLDDEFFPEYIKLAHVLSNQSLTLSDRVQRMVDLGLIHLGVRQDQQIYRRLLSAEDGADMLRFIANKLKDAKG